MKTPWQKPEMVEYTWCGITHCNMIFTTNKWDIAGFYNPAHGRIDMLEEEWQGTLDFNRR